MARDFVTEPSPFGSSIVLTESQIARLWSKVRRANSDECWIWLGAFDQDGYGTMSVNNRQRRAHRLALLAEGNALPDGMVVDHRCRNRSCVNPNHLRIVDRKTNVHENSEAPAHLNALKTHCPKGHPLSGANLIVDRGSRRCRECKNTALRLACAHRKAARHASS